MYTLFPDARHNHNINAFMLYILDENRKENAILLENAFYNKKAAEQQPENEPEEETQPEKIDAETIQNLLNDPNMVELLKKLSKTVGK